MTAPAGEGAGSLSGLFGRYFFLVSLVPSIGLTAWIFILVGSGAWTDEPSLINAWNSLSAISTPGVLSLIAVSIVVAAALHPLQFVLVQALEGYWGTGQLAVRLRGMRVAAHRRRRRRLLAAQRLSLVSDNEDWPDPVVMSTFDEASRELAQYPGSYRLVMPTRLGNMLRKHEHEAGRQYGLSVVHLTGHLAQVAPPETLRYLNDQRTAVDVAVRWCLVALIGTVAAVLLLWQHGLWLLLALMPYAMAYLSYRGAIVASRHYGRALAVLVDLNRFALYDRLRVPIPPDTAAERDLARKLNRLINVHSRRESVAYVPAPQAPDDTHRIPPGV